MFFYLPLIWMKPTLFFFFVLFFLTCIFGLFSLLLGSVTLLAFFLFFGFCFLFNELGVYQLCELWVLSVARFSGPLSSPTIN